LPVGVGELPSSQLASLHSTPAPGAVATGQSGCPPPRETGATPFAHDGSPPPAHS
jgi:hypothetical protein